MQRLVRQCVCILLFAHLTGCMVGPNFRAPHAPAAARYNEKALPAKTAATPAAGKGGVSQYFIYGEDLPGDWWRLFRSRHLNKLVKAGLVNSPNLVAAKAALRQARENLAVQIGNSLFPAISAQASAQRQKTSNIAGAAAGFGGGGGGDGFIFNLFNTSVNVSYPLDIWGGARRQVEAAAAQVDNTRYQMLTTYLTLTSNIVTTAITIASLDAQIQATKDLIRFELNQLNILREQFKLGGIALNSVLTQETLVQQTIATLPVLEYRLAQNKHALTTLLGVTTESKLPRLKLSQLTLPKKLPVSCPSDLVRQRPDILASEALLHVASAQIGVATANLLPQITITGNYGWSATVPDRLFNPSTNAWSIAAGLTQPLFQGGALLAQRRAAIAAYQQAAAQYRQTVLQAFQNVADALRAIEADARALRALEAAEIAAQRALMITQEQFKLGGTAYLALLIAQQQYQQARIRRIQAQGERYVDTAALFQALGGGWWQAGCRVCHRQRFMLIKEPILCGRCLVVRKTS